MAFWSKKSDDKNKAHVTDDAKADASGRPSNAKIAIPVVEPTKATPAAALAANGAAKPAVNGVASHSAAVPSPAAPSPVPTAPTAVRASAPAKTQQAVPQKLSAEDTQKRAMASKRLLMSFGEIVSVLMRNPQFREMPLSEIEALVVPAVKNGQFVLVEAQSKTSGFVSAVAAALWASVSADVDRRIVQNIERPFRLSPNEWNSGDIAWLVVLAGDPRVMGPALKQLQDTTLKGRPLKMPVKSADGKFGVGGVDQFLASASRKQA